MLIPRSVSDEDKAEKIVAYLGGEAFDFHFERFTMNNGPKTEAKSYQVVKEVMLKKKSEEENMKDAISLAYDGVDIHSFFTRAEKGYNQANFNGQSTFGLLCEALKVDLMILHFIFFRGAKDYEDVKRYCLEYAGDQKMMDTPCSNYATAGPSVKSWKQPQGDVRMDELCREVENLHLLMTKQPRSQCRQDPFCYKWNQKVHYASKYRTSQNLTCYRCSQKEPHANECPPKAR